MLNKIDEMEGIDSGAIERLAEEMNLPANYIPVSASKGWGLDLLQLRIEEALGGQMAELEVLIPYTRNDLVALWRQRGLVEHEEYQEQGVHLLGRLPIQLLSQFAPFRVAVPSARAKQ